MQTIKRFFYIWWQLTPPVISIVLFKKRKDTEKLEEAAIKLPMTFQKLGPTYIKLDQMLSSRPDIVGPELASELRNLLYNEPPLPFTHIKKT